MRDGTLGHRQWLELKVRMSPVLRQELEDRAYERGMSKGEFLSEVLAGYFAQMTTAGLEPGGEESRSAENG